MAERDIFGPIPPAVVKALMDKTQEKRKGAALEIEKMVRSLVQSNQTGKCVHILNILRKEFVFSTNSNARNGGLIALAACALALYSEQQPLQGYLSEIIPPILSSFNDPEARVRKFACEALYNIAKVARADTLTYFNRIFDSLAKLISDPDTAVRNGADTLDRLMKDIMTEHGAFDVSGFIPILRERIYSADPHVRQFLVSWVTVLDSVPDIDLVIFLPQFLEGLFKILSDTHKEIRSLCEGVLAEFMHEIKAKPPSEVDFASMIPTLAKFCLSGENRSQCTATAWINEFIGLSPKNVIPFTALLLPSLLPNLVENTDARLKDLAVTTNQNLLRLIVDSTPEDVSEFDLKPTLLELVKLLQQTPRDGQQEAHLMPMRISCLRWLLKLHRKLGRQMYKNVSVIRPALMQALTYSNEQVVVLALEVIAEMSSSDPADDDSQKEAAESFFSQFVLDLISLFNEKDELLRASGSFIIRNLSIMLDPERLFRSLADNLLKEDDLEFARTMVQHLNIILLTSSELFNLRQQLTNLSTANSRSLFTVLYRSWSHSPVATFSLCLLSQVYEHACELLSRFGDLEITVAFLVEVDKLIQLLESPIFARLRLQLLEPKKHAHLIKCLYGLLMLLPQSTAFNTLKKRLDCMPAIAVTLGALEPEPKRKGSKALEGVPFDELLQHFDSTQKMHADVRRTLHNQEAMLQTEF